MGDGTGGTEQHMNRHSIEGRIGGDVDDRDAVLPLIVHGAICN